MPVHALSSDSQWVTIAKLMGAYGVKGWLRLCSFTQPEDSVFEYRPWRIIATSVMHDHSQYDRVLYPEAQALSYKRHRKGWVVDLDICRNREQAASLNQAEIQVLRSCLPELDEQEFYWADLLGAQVIDESCGPLGFVKDFIETGGHDVMVVDQGTTQKGSKKTCLIPFVLGVYVDRVDLAHASIWVNWPWDSLVDQES